MNTLFSINNGKINQLAGGLAIWVGAVLWEAGFPRGLRPWQGFRLWFKHPENASNALRVLTWVGAIAFAGAAWTSWAIHPASELGGFRTEATGIAITVVVIEEISRWRAYLERNHEIIQQMRSRSHDFAVDAARIAKNEGWLEDGSLQGADLSDARLREVNLRHADLQRAELSGADLREANLQEANLQRAHLFEALLEQAILSGAHLQHAILLKANLQGTHLSGANLQGTLLPEANLSEADLRGAHLFGANLQHADLQGADLREANLQGADLSWAKMKDANLEGAKYDPRTIRPDGLDFIACGAVLVDEQDKNDQGITHVEIAAELRRLADVLNQK